MNSEKWMKRPTSIVETTEDITHVLFIDENGSSEMNTIKKSFERHERVNENDKFFGVTAVLCEATKLNDIKCEVEGLKSKYWPPDGNYVYSKGGYKHVCFHSKEIRRKTGPFSNNVINYSEFATELSSMIEKLPIQLFSCFVDKEMLYSKYRENAYDPYTIAIECILERVLKYHLSGKSIKLYIILEGRGKREDKIVLEKIISSIRVGGPYASKTDYEKIKGVFFDDKWVKGNTKRTVFGLEIADLCAYPIYHFCRYGNKDKPFVSLENKLYGWPFYKGKGIKIFP